MKSAWNSRYAGFTLFELFVSMSVIAILALATLGSITFRPKTLSVEEGANRISDLARAARSQAIMSGARARLIINYDPNDEDNYLRQIGILVETEIDSGDWKATDRGILLPDQIYVDPSKCKYDSTEGIVLMVDAISNSPVVYPILDVAHLNPASGSGASHWISIGFRPNGRMEDGTQSDRIAVAAGALIDGAVSYDQSIAPKGVAFRLSGFSYMTDDFAN